MNEESVLKYINEIKNHELKTKFIAALGCEISQEGFLSEKSVEGFDADGFDKYFNRLDKYDKHELLINIIDKFNDLDGVIKSLYKNDSLHDNELLDILIENIGIEYIINHELILEGFSDNIDQSNLDEILSNAFESDSSVRRKMIDIALDNGDTDKIIEAVSDIHKFSGMRDDFVRSVFSYFEQECYGHVRDMIANGDLCFDISIREIDVSMYGGNLNEEIKIDHVTVTSKND